MYYHQKFAKKKLTALEKENLKMINYPFNYNLGEFFLTISCVLIQVWLAVSQMSFDI